MAQQSSSGHHQGGTAGGLADAPEQFGRPASTIDFRILGPLEIVVDGLVRQMPGGKPKAVLAVLLINRNRVVPSAAIADAIWDGNPPPTYPAILQVYISTLRRSLRAAGIDTGAVVATQAPGYRLLLDDRCVDYGRFSTGVTAGDELLRARRYAPASETLGAALAEWTGDALADLRGLRFADDFAAAVDQERLAAVQGRIEADLARGMDSAVVGELTALTGRHPLREPFWIQLITALYRLGRQAEALDASRRIRELLSEELGVDPSPALQQLEHKILRQESLDPAPATGSSAMLKTVSDTAVVLSSGRLVLPGGQEYPVPSRGLRIGRMQDNDLVIENTKVSRYHAVVTPMGKGFAVNDLRSTNGITVGELRVLDSHVLRDGDVIGIGGVDLVFRLGE